VLLPRAFPFPNSDFEGFEGLFGGENEETGVRGLGQRQGRHGGLLVSQIQSAAAGIDRDQKCQAETLVAITGDRGKAKLGFWWA